MTNTGTPKYQTDPGVKYEPPDELTQKDLERLIQLARDVYSGKLSLVTVAKIGGRSGLFIKGYKSAA